MANKPHTANLSTDRICHLQQKIMSMGTAQIGSYALEMKIMEADIMVALGMAWEFARDREASKRANTTGALTADETQTTTFQLTMLIWLPMIIPFTVITLALRFMALVSEDYWQTLFGLERSALRKAFPDD